VSNRSSFVVALPSFVRSSLRRCVVASLRRCVVASFLCRSLFLCRSSSVVVIRRLSFVSWTSFVVRRSSLIVVRRLSFVVRHSLVGILSSFEVGRSPLFASSSSLPLPFVRRLSLAIRSLDFVSRSPFVIHPRSCRCRHCCHRSSSSFVLVRRRRSVTCRSLSDVLYLCW